MGINVSRSHQCSIIEINPRGNIRDRKLELISAEHHDSADSRARCESLIGAYFRENRGLFRPIEKIIAIAAAASEPQSVAYFADICLRHILDCAELHINYLYHYSEYCGPQIEYIGPKLTESRLIAQIADTISAYNKAFPAARVSAAAIGANLQERCADYTKALHDGFSEYEQMRVFYSFEKRYLNWSNRLWECSRAMNRLAAFGTYSRVAFAVADIEG
jgi:hypothetical protein